MPDPLFTSVIKNALTNLEIDRDNNLEGYQIEIMNTYQALLDKVTNENIAIKDSYPGLSVAGQKSIYIDESSATLLYLNNILFWVYIGLAIVLSVFVIIKPFSIWFKIFIVAVIITFPFYIYPAEIITYKLSIYIYSVLLSVVYNNGFANTMPEYYEISAENLKHV